MNSQIFVVMIAVQLQRGLLFCILKYTEDLLSL